MNKDIRDLLMDLADYFDDLADAEYSTERASPIPNEEMRLLTRIEKVLEEL